MHLPPPKKNHLDDQLNLSVGKCRPCLVEQIFKKALFSDFENFHSRMLQAESNFSVTSNPNRIFHRKYLDNMSTNQLSLVFFSKGTAAAE